MPGGTARYGTPIYAPYLYDWPYNVTKAKELLAEAGYPNGFECELVTASKAYVPDWFERSAIVLKDQLAKVGIRCNVVILDFETYNYRKMMMLHDLIIGGWVGRGGDTPQGILQREHSSNAGPGIGKWNFMNIRDPILDDLIERLMETPLEEWEKVKSLSDAIQRRVIDMAYLAPLCDPLEIHATSLRVQGYVIHPTQGSYIWAPHIGIEVSVTE